MTSPEPLDLITALGLLFEAANYVQENISADLQHDAGLPGPWFEVLTRLDRTPGHEVRMNTMAAEVSFAPSSFSRLIDRMEQAGLIERLPDPRSRRATLIRATPRGKARLASANLIHERSAVVHFSELLSEEEVRTLTLITRKLRDANRVLEVKASTISAPKPHQNQDLHESVVLGRSKRRIGESGVGVSRSRNLTGTDISRLSS